MRVGVLDLLIADVDCDPARRLYCRYINRHYTGIMPQAVSIWSRRLGHETFYATYWGQADPKSLLPDDLDVVFVTAYTSASNLAYALAVLYRREGTLTVLGGPHAKGFPGDSSRFFDVVVGDCDETLVREILCDLPRGVTVSSGRQLRELPTVEERLQEIEIAHLDAGRATGRSFVPLMASLGCPYACDFCTDWDNPYRLTPLDQFEADLRFISERWPRAKIPFHDPNFGVKFDAVLGVMERIPPGRRNAYAIQSSLSLLSEERLRRLHDTRCIYLAPGIEAWGDYSNKQGSRASCETREKFDEVVARFEMIQRYVPGLQANFIFGLDSDEGDEPFELTREFMDRLPQVWPNFNVPTPFGGTPLYEEHLAKGRILGGMPFLFYYYPYLVTTLRHYAPDEYYDHLIDMISHQGQPRTIVRRTRAVSGIYHAFHALRLLNGRRNVVELRAVRQLLRSDPAFRAFHEGVSSDLPAFYQQRFRRILARYAELLTPAELRPRLASGRAAAGARTRAASGKREILEVHPLSA